MHENADALDFFFYTRRNMICNEFEGIRLYMYIPHVYPVTMTIDKASLV